jgi:hypothetical protein
MHLYDFISVCHTNYKYAHEGATTNKTEACESRVQTRMLHLAQARQLQTTNNISVIPECWHILHILIKIMKLTSEDSQRVMYALTQFFFSASFFDCISISGWGGWKL